MIILGWGLADIPVFYLIQRIHDISDVPIIMLSNDKNIDMLVKAFKAGAIDYIVYPFNKSIFIAKLKAIIRRKEWDIEGDTGISMETHIYNEYGDNYCSKAVENISKGRIRNNCKSSL
jgi:DNA-binding response OmpR family regulator